MSTRVPLRVFLFLILFPLLFTVGCTPQEEQEAQALLSQGLNTLTQNRELAEATVRDLKARLGPSDPSYMTLVESYADARESYNRYLDDIESGNKAPHTRSLRGRSSRDVEDKTIAFMEDATKILVPEVNTRKIKYRTAIIIPQTLSTSVNRLPRKIREQIVDDFDQQVRWRSWGDL